MKIGIITFNSAHNYGAVLQAWSLQEYLVSESHTVEIINYRLPAIDNLYRLFVPETPYDNEKKNAKHQQKQYEEVKRAEPLRVVSFERFEAFIKEQLHTTKPYVSTAELKKETFDYDALIVGSDQVWNSTLTKGISPAYLLDFGPENARRISYAASRGDKGMSDHEKIVFGRKLANFDFISVREEQMVSMITELTECEVSVTADPTLLLSREQFDMIRLPYPCEKPYIYVHNVHVKKTDERLCAMAEELSIRTGLPVVANRKEAFAYTNYLKDASDIGPREFLDVVANAEYVVTNSFHATVFSTVYQKKFVTIPSLHSPERMVQLLERLGLSEHLLETPELLPENLQSLAIDGEELAVRKAAYAEQSKQFLRKALSADYVRDKEAGYERSYCRTANPMACYACGACISAELPYEDGMKPDEEGFLYPEKNIVKETDAEHRCLQRHKLLVGYDVPAMYMSEVTLEDPAKNRFYASELQIFCETMLAQGGRVVAKVANGVTGAEYRILRTKDELTALYAGCLVEGNIRQGVSCCKEALREEGNVLFAGSACEVTAIRMHIEDERLVTLVKSCSGVVAGRIWDKYVESQERKYESEICEMNYANLIKGFWTPYTYIRHANEEVTLYPASKDVFYSAYKNGVLNRPACYRCIYAEKWSTAVDIAVALHPGNVKRNAEPSLKLLIAVGSDAGKRLLDDTGLELTEETNSMKYVLSKLSQVPATRKNIMEQLETEDIQQLLQMK